MNVKDRADVFDRILELGEQGLSTQIGVGFGTRSYIVRMKDDFNGNSLLLMVSKLEAEQSMLNLWLVTLDKMSRALLEKREVAIAAGEGGER